MPRFKVTLTADAYMAAEIDVVEAVDAEDARAKAIQYAMEGNASWEYNGVNTETIEAQDEHETCKCGSYFPGECSMCNEEA